MWFQNAFEVRIKSDGTDYAAVQAEQQAKLEAAVKAVWPEAEVEFMEEVDREEVSSSSSED